MIKSVTVTNYLGESMTIELSESKPDHGLIIQSITGLGPAKANASMTKLAGMDGSIFNSARLENRSILLRLILEESPTIEDARLRTYKYFPIKKPVELRIETDRRSSFATGYVISNEPDVFSKRESNSIEIDCPDPYFYSAGEGGKKVTAFFGVEPTFEFEFSNESVTDDILEFGEIQNQAERNIIYDGDAEIGVLITIHALGPATNISIYNTGTRDFMQILTSKIEEMTGSGIVAGDDIIISTVRGNKYVQLLRNGVYINILNALTKDSDWFLLTRGDNVFAYIADSGSENLQFTIENRIRYEGV